MTLINGVETDFKYAGIDKFDVNNGNGVGATLFVQGCSHHCKGCHNQSTWDKYGGMQFTQKSYDYLFNILSNPLISRFTLSGGDPLDNVEFTYFLSKNFKSLYPKKKLWIYTGYAYETIIQKSKYQNILNLCDVLVDGEFKIEEKDLRLQFKGSKNQRVIDVKKSVSENRIILGKRKEKINDKSSRKIL